MISLYQYKKMHGSKSHSMNDEDQSPKTQVAADGVQGLIHP